VFSLQRRTIKYKEKVERNEMKLKEDINDINQKI
jgi:hypothetical protein